MAQSHDHPCAIFFPCICTDFKLLRQAFLGHNERVIACGGHRLGSVLKQGTTVMLYAAGFAMHHPPRPDYIAAKCGPQGLMSQTNSQDRLLAGKMTNQIDADTGLPRRAGS